MSDEAVNIQPTITTDIRDRDPRFDDPWAGLITPPGGGGPALNTSGSAGQGLDRFLTILSAVIGAFGAYRNAKNQNDAIEARNRALDAAQRIATPEEFERIVTTLLPGQRALAQAGPGAAVAQAINTRLSRVPGANDTGFGDLAASSAAGLPELEALRSSTATAFGQQALGAQTALARAGLIMPEQDVFSATLAKALTAGFQTEAELRKRRQGQNKDQNNLFVRQNIETPTA